MKKNPMDKERERLVKELYKAPIMSLTSYDAKWVVEFIIEDRKRICEPLVIYQKAWEMNHYKVGFINSWVNQDAHIAIDETLRLAGLEGEANDK